MYIYPYFDIPKSIDDLFLDKYRVHSKYHNDKVWLFYKMGEYK